MHRNLISLLFPRFSIHHIKKQSNFVVTSFKANFAKMPEVSPTKVNKSTPVIGTHDGTFHADEVLACFMLKQLPEYESAEIFRSRNINLLREKCDIIIDVGSEFDHDKKWYDHHQSTFHDTINTVRPDFKEAFNIRLSSAGLIYAFYGERVIQSILKANQKTELSPNNLELAFLQIYRNFICEVDAIDNGVLMFEGCEPRYKISTHFSARIGKFNPSWDAENTNVTECFERAMNAAGKEFVDNVLEIACSWIKARDHVREALLEAKTVDPSGEILVLKTFCPWKSHLADLEKEYDLKGVPKLIIYADGSSWRVSGVPITPSSFAGRKFLPVPWRGLRDGELSRLAGIEDLSFVHHTGFIGGAKTKSAALKMARKSVAWPDE